MEPFPAEDSGIFRPAETTAPRTLDPEAIIVGVAWLLAIAQIAIGVARSEPFGPDRAVAVAFAVGCPLLARSWLIGRARRWFGRPRQQ